MYQFKMNNFNNMIKNNKFRIVMNRLLGIKANKFNIITNSNRIVVKVNVNNRMRIPYINNLKITILPNKTTSNLNSNNLNSNNLNPKKNTNYTIKLIKLDKKTFP